MTSLTPSWLPRPVLPGELKTVQKRYNCTVSDIAAKAATVTLWGARRDTHLGRSYRGKYRSPFLQGITADVDVVFVDRLRVVAD